MIPPLNMYAYVSMSEALCVRMCMFYVPPFEVAANLQGFALCRQPFLVAQDKSERTDFEILRILILEIARKLDSGAKFCLARFCEKADG